ncbi:protein MEI2-like 6 [Forsythia ovata]|uniref:Protein MEI2-like 6 n=1 Tax=Forsythia ovata TaxID=205694 RepID=A0ABD1PVT6_9LAMI
MASPFNSKKLNPLAKEWIPSKSQKRTPFHHHQQFPPFRVILQPEFQSASPLPQPLHPPPQQPVQPVETYSSAQAQAFLEPYYHPPLTTLSSYQCFIVYDTNSQSQPCHPSPVIPIRPDGYFYGETGGSFVEIKELVTGTEMKTVENDFKNPCRGQRNVESPKVARSSNGICVDGGKRGNKRFFPPRLLITRRARRPECGKKIDGGKLEWRPKEPVSEDGLAVVVGVPSSPFDFLLSENEKTTIMMKNIPNQMRRDDLMEFLDCCCREYSLEYDFLYLPMDFRTKKNLGYAFVNFTTAAAALKMMKILQNYKWGVILTGKESFTSKKICEITWARIQGKENLIRRFEASIFTCDRLDFLPVILSPPRNGSSSITTPMILGRCIAAK